MLLIFSNTIDFQAARECFYCLDMYYFEHSHHWEIFILNDQDKKYLEDYKPIKPARITEIFNSIECLADYKKLNENQLKNLIWYLAGRN